MIVEHEEACRYMVGLKARRHDVPEIAEMDGSGWVAWGGFEEYLIAGTTTARRFVPKVFTRETPEGTEIVEAG